VKYNQDIPKDYEWYRNQGQKSEVSFYTKLDYTFLQQFNAFLDLQVRSVNYAIKGIDDNFADLSFSKNYPFFNPKIGLSYLPDACQKWYVSVAQASREPNRADIKEILRSEYSDNMVKAEHLTDYELGYQIQKTQWAFGSNIYFMDYKNQLVPNGRVNDNGYALMDNVKNSYRLGIELVGSWQICKPLKLDANLTLSQNKIRDYLEIHPVYDNPVYWTLVKYDTNLIKSGNLVYSPSVVSSGMLTYSPISNLYFTLTGKYVGKQFYDNLSEKSLPAYFVSDLSVYYAYPLKKEGRKFYVQGIIHNLFNKDYISNAWVETYFTETDVIQKFFVQAPIHFSIKIGFSL